MSEVGNLNFSVIINDADFNAKCEAIEKRAQEMNTNLSNAFQIESMKDGIKNAKQYEATIEELRKKIETLSQSSSLMGEQLTKAANELEKMKKSASEGQNSTAKEASTKMTETAGVLNQAISYYKKIEEINNRVSTRQMAGKWGVTKEESKALEEYAAKYERLMEKVNKKAESSAAFAALKAESEAIAQAEVQLQKRNMAEKEYISILKERLQIQAKANTVRAEYDTKGAQGIDNSAEAKAYQDYAIQLQNLDSALNRIKSQYSELDAISQKAFDIQDIGKALDYLNKMDTATERITKKDLSAFNKQMKEYVSLEKQIAKLETDLNVRKVSNKDAIYTDAEDKKLADHIAKQKQLRAELDKLIAKYPQLKTLFDQTHDTTKLEAAVEAERRIARETERVTREKDRQNKAIQAGIRHTANMTTEAKKLTMETGKVTKYWNQFKNILGGATSIYAIKRILSNLIEITGEFELQRTTLRAILQDANKADVIFEKIKGLALVSPFNFKELISYTKQLSAFSIPANELYDTTKMLADLSAGLGIEMNRLILAFGQVRSAAFLRGQEVRQFTEAGIPLLEALRKEFERLGETGITTGQVFDKISNRLVSFEMVKKVLTDMTEEGGKFYNMQEVQSETLKGKFSNLKDAFQMMFNEIGESQSELMKSTVDALREMMSNWEQVGKDIIALIAAFGTYKVVMASLPPIINALTLAQKSYTMMQIANVSAIRKGQLTMTLFGNNIGKHIKQLRIVKALGNPYVMVSAGVAALGFAIYKCVTYQTDLQKAFESINDSQKKYNSELDRENSKLAINLGRLKELQKGTEEYDKLERRLITTYDEYLTKADKQIIANKGIANSYDVIAAAIGRVNQEKWKEGELVNIDEQVNSKINEFSEKISKELAGQNIDSVWSEWIIRYLKGEALLSKLPEEVKDTITNFLNRTIRFNTNQFGGYLGTETGKLETALSNYLWKIEEFSIRAKSKVNQVWKAIKGEDETPEVALQEYQQKVQAYYKNKFFPMIDELTKEQQKKLSSQPFWASDVKNNEGGIAYAKTLKEQFDKITNDLKQSEMLSAQTVEDYKAQLVTIKEIDKIFNGAILRDTSEKKGGKTEKNPYEDEIQALKLEYDLLKKVQSAYEDLRNAGFGDEKISKFFSDTLGTDFKGLNFASQINTITASLRRLGEEGEKAADVIINSAKKVDITSATKDMIDGVQQATERLKRLYDEFDSYIIEGNGITFDFSKILKESSKAITKIEAERKRSLEDLNTRKILLDEQAYQKEEKLIKNIYDTQIANQKKVTSEKIRELAKAIISDQNQKTSLDFMMNDISGQNIFQLGKLKNALAEAKAEIDRYAIELADTGMMALIEKYGDDVPQVEIDRIMADIDAAVEEAKDTRENQILTTKRERIKKLASAAGVAASKVSNFASSMIELADATNNAGLKSSMEALKGVADAVGAAAQGFASGGWIGAAISGASSLIESFITGLTSAEITAHKTEVAVKNMVNELNNLKIQNLIDGTESIFGTNSLGNVRNYYNALKEISKAMLELGNVTDDLIYADSMDRKWWQGLGQLITPLWGELGGWIYGQNIEGLNNPLDWLTGDVDAQKAQIAKDLINNLANGMSRIQSMMIKTKDYGGFLEFFGAKDKYSTLGELFPDMFDKDGNIDLSKLETALKVIEENEYMLAEDQKTYLENLLTNYQQYTQAMENITDYLSGVFGNLADDIMDNMMEAFIATGNAAIDMGDIVSSVAQQMMKDLGKSLIYSLVFDELEKAVIAMWKPYNDDYTVNEKYIADETKRTIETVTAIQNGLADVSDLSGQIAEVWQQVIDKTGINLSSTDDTLKSSIQGITEETASRLANLINGIYAETFRQGGILDSMNINVAAILSKMNGSVSENTYQDYLMQIQANTYDTAQNTQKMLERIDSVMASTGGTGGQGIKVYLQN